MLSCCKSCRTSSTVNEVHFVVNTSNKIFVDNQPLNTETGNRLGMQQLNKIYLNYRANIIQILAGMLCTHHNRYKLAMNGGGFPNRDMLSSCLNIFSVKLNLIVRRIIFKSTAIFFSVLYTL